MQYGIPRCHTAHACTTSDPNGSSRPEIEPWHEKNKSIKNKTPKPKKFRSTLRLMGHLGNSAANSGLTTTMANARFPAAHAPVCCNYAAEANERGRALARGTILLPSGAAEPGHHVPNLWQILCRLTYPHRQCVYSKVRDLDWNDSFRITFQAAL